MSDERVQATTIECETCTVTVEADGQLKHEDRCTIEMYRAALAEARQEAETWEAECRRVRPKADAYDRACQSLGIEHDILGYIAEARRALEECRGHAWNIKHQHHAGNISRANVAADKIIEQVDAALAPQEREGKGETR